jgi:EAL domain-containing protein (putative c-di-GMP-specific phosphodiesterase class I)
MTSTAEGVETKQQMEVLQAIGCTEMQGYLFSHARPAHEIRQFFARRSVEKAGAA